MSGLTPIERQWVILQTLSARRVGATVILNIRLGVNVLLNLVQAVLIAESIKELIELEEEYRMKVGD